MPHLPLIFHGRVVKGRGRGKDLGFPTANLGVEIPPDPTAWGVYRGWVAVEGQWHAALVHLGPAAVFGDPTPRIEAHLLDWSGSLEGVALTVRVDHRLRGTRSFKTSDDLRQAMLADRAAAMAYFKTARPPALAPSSSLGAAAYDPSRLRVNRAVWEHKPVLRKIYHDWYRRIAAQLVPAGKTLEVGCGIGNFKAFKPDVVATDMHQNPWVDAVADAEALPFANESFGNVVAVDVVHHLRRPVRFLRQAERVLVPGGRLILLEPWITPWSYLVYRFAHHEPLAMKARPPITPEEEAATPDQPGEFANEALPTLLFGRYQTAVLARLPQMRLAHQEYLACVLYPLSGGFSQPSFVPSILFSPLAALDKFLVQWFGRWCALRRLLVLEKVGERW